MPDPVSESSSKPPRKPSAEPGERRRTPRGPSGRGATRRPEDVLVVVDRSVDPHLMMYHDPTSGIAEQYRTLRTNLVALNSQAAPRALVVTSSIKGEGKSVSVANLGLALAELPEVQILVVDADLREPSQGDLFGLQDRVGLADLLMEGAPLDRVIAPTLVPNLSVMPAGRTVRNPSELLGSPRITDLIRALKAEYHYILFDTPPVLACVDASVLGGRVDGSLMVVRMDRTPRDQVERSLATLKAARNNVIGCFLAGSRTDDGNIKEYILED